MATNQNIIRCEQDGVEFFVIDATGETGMSYRGLARLCGKSLSTIQNVIKNLTDGKAPKRLEPLLGKELHLTDEIPEKNGGQVKVLRSFVCVKIIKHYAFEGSEIAEYSSDKFEEAGIDGWIHKIAGWQQTPSMLSLPGEPYWYKRVKLFLAQNKVPDGYFSIFQETIGLVADIETAGYILPDNAIPDISIGKCWANHLRNTGIKPESISVLYKHQYPGWAYPIEAKAYLEDYLPPFRRWFRESYKTEKMPKYFKGKDQSALPAISKLLGLPASIKI